MCVEEGSLFASLTKNIFLTHLNKPCFTLANGYSFFCLFVVLRDGGPAEKKNKH
jgi:hypothetical protein